jgi:hypothetical protein
MRQVFTSARLETVEGVARLLEDAGIEVRIRNGRSYHGARRRPFSFHDSRDAAPWPTLWIVRPEDQPRARQLLREAGLLDSTREPLPPLPELGRRQDPASRALRWRLALLVVLVAGAVLMLAFGRR